MLVILVNRLAKQQTKFRHRMIPSEETDEWRELCGPAFTYKVQELEEMLQVSCQIHDCKQTHLDEIWDLVGNNTFHI